MEILLTVLLPYLISLAANERSSAIHKGREEKLRKVLESQEKLKQTLAESKPLRRELELVAIKLAKKRRRAGISPQEEPLFHLLTDEPFQSDLADWLMAGGIAEGKDLKDQLAARMQAALEKGGASQEQLDFLKDRYFEAIEREVFSDPTLAAWRHNLSLDFLREQVAVLRQRADEAAGVYSQEKQREALYRYCEMALNAWDPIDLSNLPEGDVQIATQALLLRQLYVPLRIIVEPPKSPEEAEAALVQIEVRRDRKRMREAGRLERHKGGSAENHFSAGQCLGSTRRLVVLGDPGGGKTTLLRWMATAYLLRRLDDSAFHQLPDIDTLPAENWIPILIRCRDLGEGDLCRSFTDFVAQHLKLTELQPEEAEIMTAVVLDSIARGEALLLVDGLDEISDPKVRTMFCKELERTAARYPETPIIVTSRIVGYRDMPYRMGSGFEHGIIAELTREDKENFARRWVEVTEQNRSTAEREKRTRELMEALHSGDRIERLTGNPMLLTTLALVKRKVGKLPSRRTKLYAEAVSVLLNWNPERYDTIDENEAIPQLEYVAYEMCRRGVQRLTEDEILDLLDGVREAYPHVRAIRNRKSKEFLQLLEARSSILIKSGGQWFQEKGTEKPVWEFRHLTFQEYLAACAILDGKYPGRKKGVPLAEQIAPLAGALEEKEDEFGDTGDFELSEAWREALRLCVADCPDDDVDEVLLAILTPLPKEDVNEMARPRAVLAALCLADEPNVSDETAQAVLDTLVQQLRYGDGNGETSLDRAAVEVNASLWASQLKKSLMHEFQWGKPNKSINAGELWGFIEEFQAPGDLSGRKTFFENLTLRLRSEDPLEAASAALTIMQAAFTEQAVPVPGLVEGLLALLRRDRPLVLAAAWALLWLSNHPEEKPFWKPKSTEVTELLAALGRTHPDNKYQKLWLAGALGGSGDARAVEPLISLLEDSDKSVRRSAAKALGNLGDPRAVEPLIFLLEDSDESVRVAAANALGDLGDQRAVEPLIRLQEDSEKSVRMSAAEALEKSRDAPSREASLRLLKQKDEE